MLRGQYKNHVGLMQVINILQDYDQVLKNWFDNPNES